MRIQAVFFGFIVSAHVFSGHQAWAEKIRFEDLPRLVREKNENVAASRQILKAQEQRTGRLARSFLPQISAQAGHEEFKAGSLPAERKSYWRIDGTLNLYRGGRDRIEDQIRRSQRNFASTSYASEFQTELREAKKAFWGLVSVYKRIAERTEAIEKNEINLRSARKRVGAGLVTTADTSQFELHEISLKRELKRLELEKDQLLNQLSVALALDDHKNISIVADFPPIKPELVAPLEVTKQLDIAALKELATADELRARQLSRWLRPKVDLYASYGLPSLTEDFARSLRDDREMTAGVRVSFDLGQGIEDRNEAAARSAEADAKRLQSAHKLREVNADNHELRHDLKVLGELIAASEDDVKRAEKFLRLTEREYARGVQNGPDLLEAFQKYFEFRDRRIEYFQDYLETRSDLESLIASGTKD